MHLGWHPTDVHRLGLAALLHDVGKLSIPDSILQKPSRLTAQEYEVIKSHAAAGSELLATSPALRSIAAIVRSHHERLDGAGYPDGLAGAAVPLLARAVSVCDGYDAMAFSRQYRDGMGHERALAVLREHSGTQWDAALVEALAETIVQRVPTRATLRHVGHDTEFVAVADCSCIDAVPSEFAT